MKTTTTFIRDTPYSFLRESKQEDGTIFHVKIERGNPDYWNACMLFHMFHIDISIGNKVSVETID